MNIALNRTGVTVTRDLSSPPPSGVGIDFVQSMVKATRKFRKMGRDDARAGKVISADEICKKLEVRFAGTDPLVANAVARMLSSCYAEGIEEVRYNSFISANGRKPENDIELRACVDRMCEKVEAAV